MAKNHPAILWDVGGTLVDFACTLPQAVRSRLASCDVDHSRLTDQHIEQTYLDFISTEQQWRTIAHERAAECNWLAALLRNQPFDPAAIKNIASIMPRYFNLYRPVPGLLPLLDDLRTREIPMAIVSNWPPSLPEFLHHHGLTQYFGPIVYSAQDGIHKPDPRIFQRALHALRTTADRAIFIGDNPELDIRPARAMGMRAINFDPRRNCDARDAEDVPLLRKLLDNMLAA